MERRCQAVPKGKGKQRALKISDAWMWNINCNAEAVSQGPPETERGSSKGIIYITTSSRYPTLADSGSSAIRILVIVSLEFG
jgi:hypothetical protein